MGMIGGIIKKYEAQGKQKQRDARVKLGMEPTPNLEKHSGDGIIDAESGAKEQAKEIAEVKGYSQKSYEVTPEDMKIFEYNNKLVEFYKNIERATIILNDLNQHKQVLEQLNQLREENVSLKDRINQLEQR